MRVQRQAAKLGSFRTASEESQAPHQSIMLRECMSDSACTFLKSFLEQDVPTHAGTVLGMHM